jgi:predicted secreted protein
MKLIGAASVAILALACTAGSAWSGVTDDTGPQWLSSIADQKLIAVDGSSITLTPADDKLVVATASPSGAAQARTFALINDDMGTIADSQGRVTGFFRVTANGLEAQFGDGHTEQLSLNGAGGIFLATHASSGNSCMAWYPAGHVFSEAERRAAVADFASRLGLQAGLKAPHVESCSLMKSAAQPVSAPIASSHGRHATQTAANDTPIMVRSSVVHAIDAAATVPMAAPPPVMVTPIPAASVPAPAAPQPIKWTATARAEDPAATPQVGHGASDCLSVESDGSNLGFRNSCGYGVQFAYCLQMASESDASCDAGSKTGDVAAKGFAPVVFDANIKAADAEHDFRWVACSGAASEVTAHLDRADPPAGRCVRAKSS